MATPYTLEMYELLVKAIAEGARVVRYQDKWIEYRSLAEMYQIKSDMEVALGLKKSKCQRIIGQFNNGT